MTGRTSIGFQYIISMVFFPSCQVRVSRFYQSYFLLPFLPPSLPPSFLPSSLPPPSPNSELQISVSTAGPQLWTPDRSGQCQCQRECQNRCQVEYQNVRVISICQKECQIKNSEYIYIQYIFIQYIILILQDGMSETVLGLWSEKPKMMRQAKPSYHEHSWTITSRSSLDINIIFGM